MMDAQDKAQTARRRDQFLWKTGVLKCGLTSGLLYVVAMSWLSESKLEFSVALALRLTFLPVWLGAGYVWAAILWRWKLEGKEDSEDRTP